MARENDRAEQAISRADYSFIARRTSSRREAQWITTSRARVKDRQPSFLVFEMEIHNLVERVSSRGGYHQRFRQKSAGCCHMKPGAHHNTGWSNSSQLGALQKHSQKCSEQTKLPEQQKRYTNVVGVKLVWSSFPVSSRPPELDEPSSGAPSRYQPVNSRFPAIFCVVWVVTAI